MYIPYSYVWIATVVLIALIVTVSHTLLQTIMQAYAEIFHYQNTSANIALFDAVGGEEEAFVHSVRPFPFHLIPAYQPVMPWPVTKQKIDKDFILVCEFSEIIGPTSLVSDISKVVRLLLMKYSWHITFNLIFLGSKK